MSGLLLILIRSINLNCITSFSPELLSIESA